MKLPRLVIASVLTLAGITTLPTAFAQDASAECRPEDIEFWYNLSHEDNSSEQVENASDIQQGDSIWFQANADLHCEGQVLTLVTWQRDENSAVSFQKQGADFYQPRAHADFTYLEMYLDVPDCMFRVELWMGEARTGILLDSADGGSTPCWPPGLECQEDTAATANADGSVTLTWSAAPEAETYIVMRMVHGSEEGWQKVGEVEATTFTDAGTQTGVTYDYWVFPAAEGPRYGEDCPIVQVTAVPFFGAPLLGALATVGAVGAYATLRRRG